jgi:hypothetical protein
VNSSYVLLLSLLFHPQPYLVPTTVAVQLLSALASPFEARRFSDLPSVRSTLPLVSLIDSLKRPSANGDIFAAIFTISSRREATRPVRAMRSPEPQLVLQAPRMGISTDVPSSSDESSDDSDGGEGAEEEYVVEEIRASRWDDTADDWRYVLPFPSACSGA